MIPRRMSCPCCGSRMTLTSSHAQCTELRDQYARCDNPHCSASYLVRWQIDKLVSPPSDLFAPRVKHLQRVKPDEVVIDQAAEYVSRYPFAADERDRLLADCATYLCKLHKDLFRDDAELIAARAIAAAESRGDEADGFWIRIDDSSATACVIGDAHGNKHVLSLHELTQILKQRLETGELF